MNAAGLFLLAALAAPEPSLEPAAAGKLLLQARFAQSAGDSKRAAVLAQTALGMAKREPAESIAVHREAQDVLLAAGEGERLVRFYNKLLRGRAADPVRRYLRARVEPDRSRRRRDLEAVLLKDPKLFWAAYDLAELHALDGDWERAVKFAERAVGLAGSMLQATQAAAWNVLGHLRLESSRLLEDPAARRALAGKAREALARATELDPRLAEAHYNLGLVRYALNEGEAARSSWLRAVELRSGSGGEFAEALNALGHMSARAGDLDEAVGFYKRALDARPGYGSAHNNIAVAYYRKGEYAHAYKHMAKAEAAGYGVAPSFRRAVVREDERRAFMAFQRELADAPSRTARVFLPDRSKPAATPELRRRELVLAALKARFRDSGGGVRLGERRLRGKAVARYLEAARVEIDMGPRGKRELLVIARESASRSSLVTWVVDAGFRFSAEAPELVGLVSGLVSLDTANKDAQDGQDGQND